MVWAFLVVNIPLFKAEIGCNTVNKLELVGILDNSQINVFACVCLMTMNSLYVHYWFAPKPIGSLHPSHRTGT